MNKQQLEQEITEAKIALRSVLKNGQKVYVKLNRVSASGMSRNLSFYIPSRFKSSLTGNTERTIRNITFYVARAAGYKLRDCGGSRGLVVGGCGMDMGFHVVDTLGHFIGRKLRHEWL